MKDRLASSSKAQGGLQNVHTADGKGHRRREAQGGLQARWETRQKTTADGKEQQDKRHQRRKGHWHGTGQKRPPSTTPSRAKMPSKRVLPDTTHHQDKLCFKLLFSCFFAFRFSLFIRKKKEKMTTKYEIRCSTDFDFGPIIPTVWVKKQKTLPHFTF